MEIYVFFYTDAAAEGLPYKDSHIDGNQEGWALEAEVSLLLSSP